MTASRAATEGAAGLGKESYNQQLIEKTQQQIRLKVDLNFKLGHRAQRIRG